jgi:hypothetical protein
LTFPFISVTDLNEQYKVVKHCSNCGAVIDLKNARHRQFSFYPLIGIFVTAQGVL